MVTVVALPFDFATPLPLPTEADRLTGRLAGTLPALGTALTVVSGHDVTVTVGERGRITATTLADDTLAVTLTGPAGGTCWLLLGTPLALRLADLLMGGAGLATATRPPSDLERRLVTARLTEAVQTVLTDAFEQPGRWAAGPLGTPRDAGVTAELAIVHAALAIDGADPEPLLLAVPLAVAPVAGEPCGDARGALAGVRLPVQAHLGRAVVHAGQLAELAAGDVLTLAHPVDDPVTVSVDGRPVLHARLAARRGRLSLVVTSLYAGAAS